MVELKRRKFSWCVIFWLVLSLQHGIYGQLWCCVGAAMHCALDIGIQFSIVSRSGLYINFQLGKFGWEVF